MPLTIAVDRLLPLDYHLLMAAYAAGNCYAVVNRHLSATPTVMATAFDLAYLDARVFDEDFAVLCQIVQHTETIDNLKVITYELKTT